MFIQCDLLLQLFNICNTLIKYKRTAGTWNWSVCVNISGFKDKKREKKIRSSGGLCARDQKVVSSTLRTA